MRISSVDLSNVTHISIHWNMLCSQNMVLTLLSFVNSTHLSDILPSSSVERLYRTYSTQLNDILPSSSVRHLSNISHLHVNIVISCKKKSKFKQILNLKKFSKTRNYNINMQTSKHLSNISQSFSCKHCMISCQENQNLNKSKSKKISNLREKI